jgi:hypothetical protein
LIQLKSCGLQDGDSLVLQSSKRRYEALGKSQDEAVCCGLLSLTPKRGRRKREEIDESGKMCSLVWKRAFKDSNVYTKGVG